LLAGGKDNATRTDGTQAQKTSAVEDSLFFACYFFSLHI
jgi:hypothetical protein